MVAQENKNRPKLTLDFDHQRAVTQQLQEFAGQVFEGTHTAETEFTRKDYVLFGLADKARVTFDAIQMLCDQSLIDDAFVLVRAMIEAIINGAYVAHMGDQTANDYADFPDYWNWIEFTELQAVAPEITDQTPQEQVKEMREKYEAVKNRYAKFRRGEWCQHSLFQRASIIDAGGGKDFNLMRILVNLPWRKASAYAHGTAASIISRVHETDSGVDIKRTFTREEAAGLLYMANWAMFALIAFVDLRLGKRHVTKWRQLYDRWGSKQTAPPRAHGGNPMKRKNPAITAVLNFFLPGLGFTYLGSPFFIVTGIAFFACVIWSVLASADVPVSGAAIAADVGALLVFAAISWEVTNLFNASQAKSAP